MGTDAQNLSATEVHLGLPRTSSSDDSNQRPKKPPPSLSPSGVAVGANKRALDDTKSEEACLAATGDDQDDTATPAKARVVGWPPVRAYRKNTTFLHAAAAAASKKKAADEQQQPGGGGLYVKVSMDGSRYLRKVDLRTYTGYRELRDALDALFTTKSFSAVVEGGGGDRPYAVAYEDKESCSWETCPGTEDNERL